MSAEDACAFVATGPVGHPTLKAFYSFLVNYIVNANTDCIFMQLYFQCKRKYSLPYLHSTFPLNMILVIPIRLDRHFSFCFFSDCGKMHVT